MGGNSGCSTKGFSKILKLFSNGDNGLTYGLGMVVGFGLGVSLRRGEGITKEAKI